MRHFKQSLLISSLFFKTENFRVKLREIQKSLKYELFLAAIGLLITAFPIYEGLFGPWKLWGLLLLYFPFLISHFLTILTYGTRFFPFSRNPIHYFSLIWFRILWLLHKKGLRSSRHSSDSFWASFDFSLPLWSFLH